MRMMTRQHPVDLVVRYGLCLITRAHIEDPIQQIEDGPLPVQVEAAGHGQVPEPYTEATAPPEVMLFVVETIMTDNEHRRL